MELVVDVFEKGTNYWLVRTSSGKWYEDFVEGKFIAIETQGLTKEELTNLSSKEEIKILLDAKIQRTIDEFDKNYEGEKDSYYISTIEKMDISEHSKSHISSRIHAFCNEIQEGDYIIIPSESSKTFAIGVVTSEILEENESTKQLNILKNSLTGESNYFTLLRKVSWVKFVSRKDVPLELLNSFLTVHHSIINLNSYKFYFQNLINPIFIDEESKLNMRINVLNNDGLPTKKWMELMSRINVTEELSEIFFKEIKIDVKSPGDINILIDAMEYMSGLKKAAPLATLILVAHLVFDEKYANVKKLCYRFLTKEGRAEAKANIAKHELEEMKHKIETKMLENDYEKHKNDEVQTTIHSVTNKMDEKNDQSEDQSSKK